MSSENPVAVVDISKMDQEAADQLVKAASTLGFIFIEGSGFTQKEVDEMFDLSRRFFSLPYEQKNEVPIDPSNHGYSAMNVENLDPGTQAKGDPKEAFNFGQFINGRPEHPIPQFFEDNIDQLQSIQAKCHDLCSRLFVLLGMGLKVDENAGGKNWFADRHQADKKSGSILRFLFYPGQKKTDPQEIIRAGAHTDYGSMTLLFQKEGEDGLEIHHPVTKQWTPVPFLPAKDSVHSPPIIVNVADMLSFWTAGILRSSMHRVKFPLKAQLTGQDRYSIVYFCHPQNTVLLEPVPSPIVAEVKNRGANRQGQEIKTAEQHLADRLAKTYGWKY
ncbi:hypothetical protein TRVA0_030S00210 [Trichomonascus vanleenenianus]|uniref:uncharacterized protein n=1 Tax=Trichomonascus vanleenenianus TaxID=2268995 RepID=UPI003ECA95D2